MANCEGKCGRTVSDPGKWCPSCWVELTPETDPIRHAREIRSLYALAYAAAFRGWTARTATASAQALADLTHVVNLLRNEPSKDYTK